MQKVSLNDVLALLLKEGEDSAKDLIHTWYVQQFKEIHESLLQEDDSDIEKYKDEIEAEEYYEDETLSDDDDITSELDDMDDDDASDDLEDGLDDEDDTLEDRVSDVEDSIERLKAEFEQLMALEEPEHDMDIDGDGEIEGEDVDLDLDDDDLDSDDFDDVDDMDDSEDSLDDDSDDLDDELKEDDFLDLDESFDLESVRDPMLSGDKEIGNGSKFSVNDKSPLPQKKGPDRVGGTPVMQTAKQHKGYDREPSPEVRKSPLLRTPVRNAKGELKSVPSDGDKSATLNSKSGFGAENTDMPVGTYDTRKSDFRRK